MREARIAIIAITTNNSTNEKPRAQFLIRCRPFGDIAKH
jgi:hypothetical protein